MMFSGTYLQIYVVHMLSHDDTLGVVEIFTVDKEDKL